MAEMFMIGQVVGASEFSASDLYCVWNIKKGSKWVHVSGLDSGQTHVDTKGEDNVFVWAHPIDVHYSTPTCVGWPKLYFQVWLQDSFGRNDFGTLP